MGVDRKSRPARRDGALITIAAVIALAFLTRTFVIDAAVVQGKSMLPNYRNGEVVVLIKAAYGLRGLGGRYCIRWGQLREGDVVAAVRPDTGERVIKRVGEIRGGREFLLYFLVGDNGLESIDSRDFGPLPLNNIIGKVLPQR